MSEQEREDLIAKMKQVGEQIWLAIDYIEHGDATTAYGLWDTATKLSPRVKIKLGLLVKANLEEKLNSPKREQ